MLRLNLSVRLSGLSAKSCLRPFSSKKVSKSKGDGEEEDDRGVKEETEALTKFLETSRKAERLKIVFSEEEQAENNRIGKEYQRYMTRWHNQLHHDAANKLWLKNDAIKALPTKLQAAAKVIDDTPPPGNRQAFPFWHTPPIKDFDATPYIEAYNRDYDKNKDLYQ